MTRTRKRGFILIAAAAAAAYAVHLEGALRPVGQALTVALPNASLVTPAIYRSDADTNAVFVAYGDPRPDGRFDATRVDVRSGALSPAAIALGPRSGFTPFIEGEVQAEVQGLSVRRPVFHLFRLPDGRGPGVHLVDSDTGVARLTVGDGAVRRTLIARWVFNSSRTAELRSLATADPAGQYVAVVSRTRGGWTLHLFELHPEES
jgi:hypothetical protein